MKREKKNKKNEGTKTVSNDYICKSAAPKTLAERFGISAEILAGEPKITILGDYQIEILNHRGIISLSETQIEINTRKYIYKIQGSSLMITALTDEELTVSGNLEKIEKL